MRDTTTYFAPADDEDGTTLKAWSALAGVDMPGIPDSQPSAASVSTNGSAAAQYNEMAPPPPALPPDAPATARLGQLLSSQRTQESAPDETAGSTWGAHVSPRWPEPAPSSPALGSSWDPYGNVARGRDQRAGSDALLAASDARFKAVLAAAAELAGHATQPTRATQPTPMLRPFMLRGGSGALKLRPLSDHLQASPLAGSGRLKVPPSSGRLLASPLRGSGALQLQPYTLRKSEDDEEDT